MFRLRCAFVGSVGAMGLPNPLSALLHVLAAALARLRGGERRDSCESPETDAFPPVKHRDDASRLANAPDGHCGEDPKIETQTRVGTRVEPPLRDAETHRANRIMGDRGDEEDHGATENARTTVRTSHDERGDDDVPSSPRPEGTSDVSWDALPEACVQRVFLHAGFRAALCAGATCTSWRRVLDSPYFWKTSFASHFGAPRDARFFQPPPPPRRGAPSGSAASPAVSPAARLDWRMAFAEETRAQRRWATGRCVATDALLSGDRVRARVAGVAAQRGRCLVARADGRVAAFDLATGAETRAWLSPGGAACACFAFSEASGVCVVGDADGGLAAYDVAGGERLWYARGRARGAEPASPSPSPPPPRPAAAAVGAGVVVVGFADGTTRALDLASGWCLRTRGATMASAVTCVAVDDTTGAVAAAAGAQVAAWRLRPDAGAPHVSPRFAESETRARVTWLVGHEAPVRCLRFVRTCGRDEARAALLTAGDDATTRAWDPASGACVLELEGPPGTTEAVHAGQVPVGWTYTPPPGITALDAWCGLVVEGRADGSVLVWTGALEGVARAMRDADTRDARRGEAGSAPHVASNDARRASVDDPRFESRPRARLETAERCHDARDACDAVSPSRVARSPRSYRRWWAHGDRVTRAVANRGRVVSVSADGSCHVLALGADALARAARWKDWTEEPDAPAPPGGASVAKRRESRDAPASSPPRRRSAELFETGAALATRVVRGGEFAGAAAAAAARRTAESWSETSSRSFISAAAATSEAWRVADRLSGMSLGSNAAAAADLAWTVGVSAGASAVEMASAAACAAHAAASATAAAAAETASIAERLTRELGRGAGAMSRSASDAVSRAGGGSKSRAARLPDETRGFWVFEDGGAAFFPGFGVGGYARGWRFNEHGSAGIELLAVTGRALITADVHGNIVVRHFGDRAAAAAA